MIILCANGILSPMELLSTHTRRSVLAATTFAATSLLLDGCSSPASPTPQNRTPVPINTPKPLNPTERLKKVVEDLTKNPIKDLLQLQVVSLFTDKPSFLQFGKTAPIPVYDPIIDHKVVPGPYFNGRYSINIPAPGKTLYGFLNTQNSAVSVVLKDLLTNEEAATFSKTDSGFPFSTLTVPANNSVTIGIYPKIEITTPKILPTQMDPSERFIYLKEACSLLAFNLWFLSVSNYSEQTGLPLSIAHSTGNHNLLPYICSRFANGNGRFIAGLDLAGYIMAIKSCEGTSIPTYLSQNDPSFREIISQVQRSNLGTTPREILSNSLRLAITEPSARRLYYQGDITKISDLQISN